MKYNQFKALKTWPVAAFIEQFCEIFTQDIQQLVSSSFLSTHHLKPSISFLLPKNHILFYLYLSLKWHYLAVILFICIKNNHIIFKQQVVYAKLMLVSFHLCTTILIFSNAINEQDKTSHPPWFMNNSAVSECSLKRQSTF